MVGIVTRPSAGLNEYSPPTSINDNYLSDMLDVTPYRDEAMILNSDATCIAGTFHDDPNIDGIIYEAATIQGGMVDAASANGYALLVFNKSDTLWFIRHAKDATLAIDTYALGAVGLPTTNLDTYNYSSCRFNTQAFKYICFTCEYVKILMYFNTTNSTVGTIALPFYPKKIAAHANRVFAIDVDNILWWCRAGDIYSWYSNEYDDDVLMAAGNMIAGAYSITGTIDVPRPITATVTKVNELDTMGTLAIVGTNNLDQVQTETLTPVEGRVQSLKSYKTITTLTGVGWIISGGNDQISFGVAPISGGYVQEDAGYWAMENEVSLTDLCVMSDNLYIFAPDNIYVFRGYSYDTFALGTCVMDLGIQEYPSPRRWLTTINNMCYFYNTNNVYEFNGSDYPRIITHPIYVNGALTNSVMGGIETLTTNYSLASDNDHLYVYQSISSLFSNNYYYTFNTKSRTWWKNSGFTKNNSVYSTVAFKVIYLPTSMTDDMVSFISVDTTEGYFDMQDIMGHKGLYDPYIITKAYNSNPSETGTLTSIILQVLGDSSTQVDITLSYSLTINGNDFVVFKVLDGYDFSEDIENIEIPVPVACIANAHHYRIKIQTTGYLEIYNIERRFRVKGRTR
jgi:hypothetical protein